MTASSAAQVGKLLLTPAEAAAALGISRSTLYVLLARGHITSVHIGTSRRVPTLALQAYVQHISDSADEHARGRARANLQVLSTNPGIGEPPAPDAPPSVSPGAASSGPSRKEAGPL